METKVCFTCKKDFPLENFGKRGKKADGSTWYHSSCKPCKKEYHRKRRLVPLDPNHIYPKSR